MRIPDFMFNRRQLFILCALLPALMISACSGRFPEERVPPMKILIADFAVPPGMKENPKEIRGWWFGADSIYQNPRAGAIMAERITSRVAAWKFVNLYSRVDLKYYYARKRQNLKEAYEYLGDDEIDTLIGQVPQLDFARELGADKLLSGRIVRNHLQQNRTFNWWKSLAEIEVEMTDVLTGRVEWSRTYKASKRFASQYTVQDELAEEIAADLRREYFKPMALAAR